MIPMPTLQGHDNGSFTLQCGDAIGWAIEYPTDEIGPRMVTVLVTPHDHCLVIMVPSLDDGSTLFLQLIQPQQPIWQVEIELAGNGDVEHQLTETVAKGLADLAELANRTYRPAPSHVQMKF